MEKTRIVTIQVTYIGDEENFSASPEEVKEYWEKAFISADQVLIDVKDFVREEQKDGE